MDLAGCRVGGRLLRQQIQADPVIYQAVPIYRPTLADGPRRRDGLISAKDVIMSTRHLISSSVLLAFLVAPPGWAQSSSPCGDTVTVNRADTLSSIAERCDTTEAAIMRANPGVEGSDDLQVGSRLNLPTASASGQQTTERLKSLARETGNALTEMAQELGASVDDLLNKNPDLQQRLRRLGDRLNIPGIDASKAQVSLSPDSGSPGTSVTVSATGLPSDTAVVIGGGAPRSAYEVLDRTRTTAEGTLRATVRIPDWAGDHERFMLTIAASEGGWKVRSSPFQITGTRL